MGRSEIRKLNRYSERFKATAIAVSSDDAEQHGTGSGLAMQHHPCSESSWSLTILLVLLQDLTPLRLLVPALSLLI